MTDIRRRRGGHPILQAHPGSEFSQDESATFASTALAPTLQGYIGRFVGAVLGIYLWIEVKLENMVFGIGRWVNGHPQNAQAQDGIPLLQTDQQTVRRRRRKDETGVADGYYPGMVNLSGVLCYMNSVLQSLASVTSLVAHLERITMLAVETDLPTPVTDALADVLAELNTPHAKPPRPIRPHNLLTALHPLPQIRRLLSTREQQDAHELFVVLAEAISDEAVKVVREIVRLRGIADILPLQAYCSDKGAITSSPVYPLGPVKEKKRKVKGLAQPWEGLIARRRVCRRCGYHTEVRMDTLGGMELPLPMSGDTTLQSCIGEYLAPELLSEVNCEMCSLQTTLAFYRDEVARLSLPPNKSRLTAHASPTTASGSFSVLEHLPSADTSGAMSDKRKKKAKDARKVVQRLEEMVESGSVSHYGEDVPIPGKSNLSVKWRKSNSESIRECILTRPPPTLRLHLDRSGYTPYGQSVKKSARVAFPIILDLTQFIARGVWEERTNLTSLLTTPKPPTGPRVLYRLESAILHYGYTTHSGHFICIRRKPSNLGSHHGPKAVTKTCPDECRCEQCIYFGKVRGEQSVPGKGWLQVSDDDIEEVGEEALMDARSAVFMLFYERVGECPRSKESGREEASESEASSSVALDV